MIPPLWPSGHNGGTQLESGPSDSAVMTLWLQPNRMILEIDDRCWELIIELAPDGALWAVWVDSQTGLVLGEVPVAVG